MLCDRWGVDICFCWEDPGWDALMHKLTHMCVRTSLSALLHTSARKPKAEAASRSRPCSLLILTHFLFPAHHSLFNCRAAHWGHLLDWGPSPWRCWEAFRIYCGLTNRENGGQGMGVGCWTVVGAPQVYYEALIDIIIVHLYDQIQNSSALKKGKRWSMSLQSPFPRGVFPKPKVAVSKNDTILLGTWN